QWRVVHAWKRAGVTDSSLPREAGKLVMGYVSCPLPGINLDDDWENDPHTYVIVLIIE
ncbi:hypothetical protein M422DRAFT_167911, partial [Sphaerobolus stellatus SS14]